MLTSYLELKFANPGQCLHRNRQSWGNKSQYTVKSTRVAKHHSKRAAIGGSVNSCAGTVSNVSNSATKVKDILRRKPRK